MTDGAARVIELVGSPAMKEHIYPRLVRSVQTFGQDKVHL